MVICADPARFAHQVRTVDVATVTALIEDCTEAAPEAASGVDTPYVLTGDDTALVVYTSGSTGRPKGAMLGHSQLDAMSAAMEERMRQTPPITACSFCHCFTSMRFLSASSPLRCGAQVTLVERFAPQPFLEIIEQHRPTYFSSVPTILSHLADLPLEGRPPQTPCSSSSVVLLRHLRTAYQVNEQFRGHCRRKAGLTEGTCCSTTRSTGSRR